MTDVLARLTSALSDRYAIERELGAGGMATVYLAEDLRHRRKVALKVLRPELSAMLGAERFLKEIEITASLQHPHLLPLFDSGEAQGLLFYVMPYVEGESLRERLTREKQLGVEEAVRLTTQVASALDYAHRRGVLHRDIKPENILLEEGQALIADFGIALALRRAGGERLTDTGLSLGTPQYMSPEQATGDRELDARSDIYSLACVLYELLAGEPPHTGPTVQAVVAKVLAAPVTPIGELRRTVPVHVAAALDVALAKLPADRFVTAAEFGEALTRPAVTAAKTLATAGARAPSRLWKRLGISLAVVVALLSIGLAFSLIRGVRLPDIGPAIYDVGLPDSAPISFTGGSPWGEGWPALTVSSDGAFVVYVAQRGETTELWYRSLVDTTARPLAGTLGAYNPMLSPDGKDVAFFSGDRLLVVPLAGGVAGLLARVDRPMGGQWAAPSQLLVSDSNGSRLRWFDPVARTEARSLRTGCYLPSYDVRSGRVLCGQGLVAVLSGAGAAADSMRPLVMSRRAGLGGQPVLGSHFQVVGGRHLVFFRPADGVLYAAPFWPERGAIGRAAPVLGGVRVEGTANPGQLSISMSGTLVFAPGENAGLGRFARISRSREPVDLPIPPAFFQRFDLSPDGRRLAAVSQTREGEELWVYDVTSGRGERWLQAYYIAEPRWDPQGRRILVAVVPEFRRRTVTLLGSPGTTSPPDTILRADSAFAPDVFAADSLILGRRYGVQTLVRADLRRRPPAFETLGVTGSLAALSPDHRWVAVISSESGRWDVFLEPFPPDGRRFKVSPEGGMEPLWLDARSLVYRTGHRWYTVAVGDGNRVVGEPLPYAEDQRFTDTWGRSNVIAPNGDILYVRGSGQAVGRFLRVLRGWTKHMIREVNEANR